MPPTRLALTFFAVILLISSPKSQGHFAESFGAGGLTTALGGQANGGGDDPANNYYAPALIEKTKTPLFSFNFSHLRSSFQGTPRGNDSINYNYQTLHLALPTPKLHQTTMGFSLFAPASTLFEINTGHQDHVDYIMYQGRNKRTVFHGNLAGSWRENYSWSLGFFISFSLTSTVDSIVSFDDSDDSNDEEDNEYSHAHLRGDTRSQLAPIISLARHFPQGSLALTYQQGAKTSLSVLSKGREHSLKIPFSMEMTSLLFYDPTTIRLSHHYRRTFTSISSQLEYQFWNSYEPPLIRIQKPPSPPSTVKPSRDLGPFSSHNIIVPKLGISLHWDSQHTTSFGLSYRPTPLGKSSRGLGNSVDLDKTTFSFGHRLHTALGDFDFSCQYHHLSQKAELGGFLLNTSLGITFPL